MAVEWSIFGGTLVERALSVMLLQDHPNAQRRLPSRGDSGVDVAIPRDGGFEVIQIKSFSTPFTPSRKRQVKGSYDSILAGGDLGAPVVAWRVLVPMLLSREGRGWWNALIAHAPFDCPWWGADHVDRLAADNPHVVDYFFQGGRDRVEQRYRDLLSSSAILEDASRGPQPAEVAPAIRQLADALNREDPNYLYSFEFSPDHATLASDGGRPGIVMARSEGSDETGWVTLRVFAHHRYATEERPITINFGLEPGSDAAIAMTRALELGADADLPYGSVKDLTVDAPGGLSSTSAVAGARVLGLTEEGFAPFRMPAIVTDPDGNELVRTIWQITDRRSGSKGKTLRCVESSGAFSVDLVIGSPDGPPHMDLTNWDVDFFGKPAVRVRDGIVMLHLIRQPNQLKLFYETDDRPLATLLPNAGEDLITAEFVRVIDDLITIDAHTPAPIVVPEELTATDARRVHRCAEILRGEVVPGRWEAWDIEVLASAVEGIIATHSEPAPFSAEVPHTITIGAQRFDLGHLVVSAPSAVLHDVDGLRAQVAAAGPNGRVHVIVRHNGDDAFEMRRREPDAS